jgi:hypothetical protein
MAVGSKIRTVDYNSVQTKIANLIGTGSGTTGWGQSVGSSQVSVSNKISVNEWANLRNDIINGYRHINGGTPSTVQAVANNIIKYNDTGSTPEQATEVVVQYDRWTDQLIANRFAVHPTQAKTENKGSNFQTWPGSAGEFWRNSVSATIAVTFTTADHARHFFNSGGQIRITSSRTDGTISAQNTAWTNLLNSVGSIAFGAQIPTTGFSPLNGQNYYRLTDTYQQWFSQTASSPYTLNTYRLRARSPGVANNSSGTARIVEFSVDFIDDYTDPDGPNNIFGPADVVDGTITISATTLEASGILVPAGLGLFAVESPTVTITKPIGS